MTGTRNSYVHVRTEDGRAKSKIETKCVVAKKNGASLCRSSKEHSSCPGYAAVLLAPAYNFTNDCQSKASSSSAAAAESWASCAALAFDRMRRCNGNMLPACVCDCFWHCWYSTRDGLCACIY